MVRRRSGALFEILLGFLQRSSPLSPLMCSDTKQKVNFTFDSTTYFLFSVRGLSRYQDEAKCQDEGAASEVGVVSKKVPLP